MRRRVVLTCVVALPLLAGALVPASGALAAARPHHPVAGGIGVQLVAEPGAPALNGLARSYIVERLAPGAGIRRRIEVSNTTRSTASISVYAAGAATDRGEFTFAPGRTPDSLSRWTSVSRKRLLLAPGATAVETVTIRVPREASSGEDDAVVWAQVSAPAPATGGITLVNRVGIRMYVSVGPGGAPPANFSIGRPTARRANSGAPLVVANVRNSGRRTLDISGKLTLSDGPGGLRAGPFPISLPSPLAPGASELATVQLDKRLPRGPWHARVRLTSGALTRSASATLTFPRPTVSTNGSGRRTGAFMTLIVVLAVAAAALLLRWRGLRARAGGGRAAGRLNRALS
jgi:hypothetical protein